MDALPPDWHAPPAIVRPAAGTGFLPSAPPARPAGISPERYRGAILRTRGTLAAKLPPRPGYRIEVLDVTAADFDGEVRRIDPALNVRIGSLRELGQGLGAYSVAYPVAGGIACLAAGHPPGTDIGGMLEGVAAGPVARNGLDDETFSRIALWHEAAHCILGRSEAEADAFAFLMALREGDIDAGALATWAAWREVSELSTAAGDDEHVTARTLWAILARSGALRADPAVAEADIAGVAAIAKAMVARHGLDAGGKAHVRRIRTAVVAGALLVAGAYPERGEASLASLGDWLEGVEGIPEFTRLRDLRAALATGAAPVPPSRFDPSAFGRFVDARAEAGDPVADAMRGALAKAGKGMGGHPFDKGYGARMAQRIPYRIGPSALGLRYAAFDPSCERGPQPEPQATVSNAGASVSAAFATRRPSRSAAR